MKRFLLTVLLLTSLNAQAAQPDPRFTFLTNALETMDHPVPRAQAAYLLGKMGNPAAITHLCHALANEESALVRNSITNALANFNDPTATYCRLAQ